MEKSLPVLTAPELRVLGALVEKSKTTPEYYPMSLNALTAACNQKTSRNPVVDYDEATVQEALNSLKGQSLAATAVGAGSRTLKYKHNFTTVYEMSEGELAILCLLMLRGAQTPGELNSNSGRLHAFQSLEGVYDAINKLRESSPPFIKELPRRAGQKETRFMHLLGGEVSEAEQINETPEPGAQGNLESRLSRLEEEMERIRQILSSRGMEL